MITKNQKELLDFLGPQYSIKTIDGEPCIYRKINSHYDIEISGTRAKFLYGIFRMGQIFPPKL